MRPESFHLRHRPAILARMAPKILITAFEAFAGRPDNMSMLVARELKRNMGSLVEMALINVNYASARTEVLNAVESCSSEWIVCLGEYTGDSRIRLERWAHNLDHSETADMNNVIRSESIIAYGAPEKIETRLPLRHMLDVAKQNQIECFESNDAGGFLCNHVFYSLMNAGYRGGFIHVPRIESENPYAQKTSAADAAMSIAADLESLFRATLLRN